MQAMLIIIEKLISGCSAAGSALGSGPRGREFKSPHSDQKAVGRIAYGFLLYICFAKQKPH